MIARIWKGVVRRADADMYAEYIRDRVRRGRRGRGEVGEEGREIADEVRPRSGP